MALVRMVMIRKIFVKYHNYYFIESIINNMFNKNGFQTIKVIIFQEIYSLIITNILLKRIFINNLY